MCRFEQWQDYKLTCGAVWEGKYTPTPFNFTTIDTFFLAEKATALKEKLSASFQGRETATVVEVLSHADEDIRGYPVLTEESQKQYARYRDAAEKIPNLILCGRLADFKYYNMDQALERVLETCDNCR